MYVKNSKSIVLLCVMSLSLVAAPVQAGSSIWGYTKYALTFASGLITVGGVANCVEEARFYPKDSTAIFLSAGICGSIGSYITYLLYCSAAQEFEDIKREDAKILAGAFAAAQIEAQRQQPQVHYVQSAPQSQSYQPRYY